MVSSAQILALFDRPAWVCAGVPTDVRTSARLAIHAPPTGARLKVFFQQECMLWVRLFLLALALALLFLLLLALTVQHRGRSGSNFMSPHFWNSILNVCLWPSRLLAAPSLIELKRS